MVKTPSTAKKHGPFLPWLISYMHKFKIDKNLRHAAVLTGFYCKSNETSSAVFQTNYP